MPQSPQHIKDLDRFPHRFSFNDIAGILDINNSSFHFDRNVKLKRIIFICDQESYEHPIYIKHQITGSENVTKIKTLVQTITTRNFVIEWDEGLPMHICDQLWFESSLDNSAIKTVIIEVSKWSN